MKLDPKESKRADLSQKRFCAIAAKIHNESDDIRHALRQAAQAATRQYLKAARLPAPWEGAPARLPAPSPEACGEGEAII